MSSGLTSTPWIDSLAAAFPGVQAMAGDLEEAICAHAFFYVIWKRYGVLPERFNWQTITPDLHFYPLRPELVESTYILYQITKNPFYLHVGSDILRNLNNITKVECGYATVHNVLDRSHEDRMESFFLSETCKYLYLLFDKDHYVNRNFQNYIFSTEGHIFKINPEYRNVPWLDDYRTSQSDSSFHHSANHSSWASCDSIPHERQFLPPLKSKYLAQLKVALGVDLIDFFDF
jgi:mannosidase alpha-like ER degradation enhancer 1